MVGPLANFGFLFLLLIMEFGRIGLAMDCTGTPIDLSRNTKQQILRYHNAVRAKVANGREGRGNPGPMPPAENMKEILWDDDLARKAQEWANRCPSGHDSLESRKIRSRNYYVGQNIATTISNKPNQQWDKLFNKWHEEVDILPNSYVDRYESWNGTGQIGHYTQLIWAETSEIGCAAATGQCSYEGKSYPFCEYLVCNYGPGGNVITRPIYKRGKPASFFCENGFSTRYPGLCKA